MNLLESLELERYKLLIDRQKYYTGLAKDAFGSYTKLLTGLAAGGIALVSTRTRLEIRPTVLLYLVDGIVYLVTFLGVIASAQIVFCLARWWDCRHAELKMNSNSPAIRWWWWLFESLYVVAILFSIAVTWHMADELPLVLAP